MWSFYMSILILGFIPGVYMVTCPQKGDIYPCTCEDRGGWMITVTCSRGSFITSYSLKILQQTLSSLNGKNDIDFRFKHANISIPSNFFAGIGIKDLEFDSCRINSLGNDDQMLTGLENHLEVLRITDCSLVPPELNLGHLKKLRNIHWSRSNITELTDDWLTYSYSLEYLSIARSNITKIGSYAFYHLMNLYSLTLEDNHFGPIQRTMFPRRANKLTRLDLENNALTDLPVDLFTGMPSIEQVYLQRNRITTLGERTWSPIWQQLDKLWLQNNNIVCDDRLKWISKSKKNPQDIFGQCSAPEKFKGMDLEAFFRSQKQYTTHIQFSRSFTNVEYCACCLHWDFIPEEKWYLRKKREIRYSFVTNFDFSATHRLGTVDLDPYLPETEKTEDYTEDKKRKLKTN